MEVIIFGVIPYIDRGSYLLFKWQLIIMLLLLPMWEETREESQSRISRKCHPYRNPVKEILL
jgi:hypothetical protein